MTHWVLRPFYHYLQKNKMEEFTSDDLTAYIENRCENLQKWLDEAASHRNLIGAICSGAVAEGIFHRTGRDKPSTRKQAKGRRIDIFRFTERARSELA